MKTILAFMFICIGAHADSDLTNVKDLIFGTGEAFHYITVQGTNDFIIQTGNGAGTGGGINLLSGSSVQISASGSGSMSLSADMDYGSITMSSHDGLVVLGDTLTALTAKGIQSLPSDPLPTCISGYRGLLYYTQSASGIADLFKVCIKQADDTYAWKTISL